MPESIEATKFRVPLLANSYDVQALEKDLERAFNLKTEDGRANAINRAVYDGALLQDVIKGKDLPSVPDGCEMAEVRAADGSIVTVPVSIPAEEDPATEDTSKGAKKGGKTQPAPPQPPAGDPPSPDPTPDAPAD